MRHPRRLRAGAAVVLLAHATACGDAGPGDGTASSPTPLDRVERIVDGDDDCSQRALSGDDEQFVFTSAYRIVDGALGERCLGVEDPTTLAAWQALATIAPASQLSDLALFAGFEPDGDDAAETLAFVAALDVDGSQFQMAVNTVEADVDYDELLLTLAHEFSHVFASTPAQLDRTDEAIEECATYFNGEGCYLPDSLILAWIEAFWDDALLGTVDPFEDSPDAAEARCAADAGFFGSYAATNPEEDFAEAFSAFVFRLEPDTEGQADRLAWIADQPGLEEFRARADAAGMTPLANNFEICGP